MDDMAVWGKIKNMAMGAWVAPGAGMGQEQEHCLSHRLRHLDVIIVNCRVQEALGE